MNKYKLICRLLIIYLKIRLIFFLLNYCRQHIIQSQEHWVEQIILGIDINLYLKSMVILFIFDICCSFELLYIINN